MYNNPRQLKFSVIQRVVLIVALLCLVSGCGGGGSSRPSPSPDQPTPTPPDQPPLIIPPDPPNFEALRQSFRDEEFLQTAHSSPLSAVKADYAYARGYTGNGVTVGVIDSGIRSDHDELVGQVDADSTNEPGYNPNPQFPGITTGQARHGTWTSSIVAAKRSATMSSPFNMHGIAFDAKVLMYGVNTRVGGPSTYTPTSTAALANFDLTATSWANFMLEREQVNIVNVSLGLSGDISGYTEDELRDALPKYIEAIAQSNTLASERTTFVFAAGNAGDAVDATGSPAVSANPEVLSGLPARIAELRGHYLAVVAVDTSDSNPANHEIADFSNHCGIAKDYCLAAPGVRIRGPNADAVSTSGYLLGDGTSASAPFVSGALAVLTQAFRDQIGNDELVKRLLQTADKSGVYADADIYGQGMLDLDAATKPQGTQMITVSNTLSGPSVAAKISSLKPGVAFGDALSKGLRGLEIASFDDLQAPFFAPLDTFVHPPPNTWFDFTERVLTLGDDPRGAVLHHVSSDVTQWRVRITSQPDEFNHLRSDSHQTFNSRLAALSFSQKMADGGRVFASLRSHPGYHFGLHQSNVLAPGQFSDPNAFTIPYLALARNGGIAGFDTDLGKGSLQFAAFHGKAQWGEQHNSAADYAWGAVAEYRPPTTADTTTILSGLRLQLGVLREAHGSIGTGATGAFGDFGSHTMFGGASGHWSLKRDWVGFVSAYAGLTRPQSQRHSLIKSVSTIWSSTMGAGLMRSDLLHKGDRLSLRLSQPLRIESGNTTLGWATGRTREGELLQEQHSLSLTPSGRQWDAEISYAHHSRNNSVNLAMVATMNPGHVADAGMRYSLLLRYGWQ